MSDGLQRLVVVLGVALAVAALVVAVASSRDDPATPAVTGAAVERLIPGRGDLAVRQAQVGVDLATGYTGTLIVDGIEIPEDQIQRIEPLNEMFFTPGAGQEIEAFQPGEVCVTAVYWPIGTGRDRSASTTWCFDVA